MHSHWPPPGAPPAPTGWVLTARRYQPWLPTEAELQAELTRDRALLELAREGGA